MPVTHNSDVSVAILGAGALGSVIGAALAEAGRPVALWTRNLAHAQAIRDQGLRVDRGGETRRVRIDAGPVGSSAAQPDLIILLTKTQDSAAAMESIAPHIARGAFVLTLQNGIGNAERILPFCPADQLLTGTTMTNGLMVAAGHVSTQGAGEAVFKAMSPAGEARAAEFEIDVPGFALRHSGHALEAIWTKAALNCAMNAAAGLTGARVGQLTSVPGMRETLSAVAAEVVAVAAAQGITVAQAEVEAKIDYATANHTYHKSSMLQDVEAGKPTEIESLCGEVTRQAEGLGLATPLNAAFAALIRLKTAPATGAETEGANDA
ncbi:ketopantoate reductase family protein [Poseidonocella sedimentorum]|uniref:2-dehydropantoate 2-reductase n=1 Tax=Poseidonocella sedimentorum TaxID=871652 RepID=A0A1I6DTV1_9RHOB|nr:2-dehydropantoate 2-reductase [Poseidonocella sedimentorum]SFR08771.1 ketopantoate reductase [Poseidonocella sedimentorum]